MNDLKHYVPQHILWFDMEVTGLDPVHDQLLEIAAIMTNWSFTELGHYEAGIKQNRTEIEKLLNQNPWAVSRPIETKKLIERSIDGLPLEEVEDRLLELILSNTSAEVVVLGGNSIHLDRQFIRHYLPRLEAKLHYRMLDVSAWKLVMEGKYGVSFPKQEKHQAMEDIRESIGELQYYLSYLREANSDNT